MISVENIYPVKVRINHRQSKKRNMGRGGLVITIPYQIIEKLNIKKGDLLLMVLKDNQLSIYREDQYLNKTI